MNRDDALRRVAASSGRLAEAQEAVDEYRIDLEQECKRAHEAGIPDRELAELTGYSRARIQQFRCGDPRKVAA